MRSTAFLSGELSPSFEAIIKRFEQAWQGEAPPDLGGYLPTSRSPNTGLLAELVHVDLEFRLRNGEPARVEHYVERYPGLGGDRATLLELIAAEYVLRRCWQAGADPAEYLQRFPEHADELRARLAAETDGGGPGATLPPEGAPALPGYQLLRELGRGGMGVVYLARQTPPGRVVAVKTVLAGHLSSAEDRARFRREIEAIARLDHPHIVPVYAVGEAPRADGQGGRPYFSMKFYPGGSLAQQVRGPSTDLPGHARLVETVARAVHHAHQRGILHRDLKPHNVLLDEAGQPHVTDFGLAKRFDPHADATPGSGVVGTPGYIAPEQARGGQFVTTASDVYGLGAILYELLTGEPPFRGETALATLLQAAERPPPRPSLRNPRVPRDLETICLKCLEKEPRQRYGSAQELAEDLARWRAGEPIQARPAAPLERAWRWCRRNPREAATAALALVLLAVAAVGAWWLDRRQAGHREDLARQEARRQAEQELLQRQARGRVRGALAQLPALCRQFSWGQAAAVLARAEQEAADLGLDELLAAVRQAQRELALAVRLDELRLDRAMIDDGGRPHRGPQLVQANREAFRKHSLDLEAGAPEELARRVRESAFREEMLAALNYWAANDARLRPRLRVVVRAVDPDAWPGRVADLLPWRGLAEQKAQLAALDVSRLGPTVLARLGRAVSEREEGEEGLDLLRAAQRRHPADFWINVALANALIRRGRHEDAIGYLRAALAVRRQCVVVQNNLGVALAGRGRPDEAIAHYRAALGLDRGAPLIHYNLGNALMVRGRTEDAILAYREAIRLRSNDPRAHNNLGNALREKGRLDEALTCFGEAVRLDPSNPEVHSNFGGGLLLKGRLDHAVAAYRRAIHLRDDCPETHSNLGIALAELGRGDEAIAAQRRAITLKPDFAEAHCYLGIALRDQGQFAAALRSLRRGHDLGSKRPAWHLPSAHWVRGCERLVELQPRLPAVLKGEAQPRDADEGLRFAQLCRCTGHHRQAARLYASAFAAGSGRPVGLSRSSREEAARSAALAAAGRAADAGRLDDSARAGLRRQALGWLRTELSIWKRLAEARSTKARRLLAKVLRGWQRAHELAGVRDEESLARLPEAEARPWRELWECVAALLPAESR
jgi:eukaryotic-like serine/threonine-protein kinase